MLALSCTRAHRPLLLRCGRQLASDSARVAGAARRVAALPEMATVIDAFNPKAGMVSAWRGWTTSTLAVIDLRRVLPEFTVPKFKDEAAHIFVGVGAALAAADVSTLRRLTTPMCFATMSSSLSARPSGEQHSWQVTRARHDPGRACSTTTCVWQPSNELSTLALNRCAGA